MRVRGRKKYCSHLLGNDLMKRVEKRDEYIIIDKLRIQMFGNRSTSRML